MRKRQWMILAAALVSMGFGPASRAQMAVVDAGAIAQLVKEVSTLQQQLQTAELTLTNEQQQFQAMIGNRGMQNLLSGTNRNYLPSTWSQLSAAVSQTGGAYQALSAGVQSLMVANAVLTPQQVAALSPAEQTQLQMARQSAALLQSTSRQALDNTSTRFASLQATHQLRYRVRRIRRGLWIFRPAFRRSRPCFKTRTRRWRCSIRRSKRRSGHASKARASKSSRAWDRSVLCLPSIFLKAVSIMQFRPGAQRVRRCLGLVVTLTSAAACAPAPDRATHTVEEYRQDATLREVRVRALCQ